MVEVVRTPVGYKEIADAAPTRVVYPVFDDQEGIPQFLAYKLFVGDDAGSIIILGRNLTGIVSVDVSEDVRVGGNGGLAPFVNGTLTVTATSIVVPLDASVGTNQADYWGVFLTDADGNIYGAPSPLTLVSAG